MAKTQDTQHPLDSYLRGIVREELSRVFSGISIDDDQEEGELANVPTTLNASDESNSGRSGTRRKRSRKGRGKGRASDPATDRRFKENREH